MNKTWNKFTFAVINYMKSLDWKVLLGIAAFCIALAAINNIRLGNPKADNAKSVEWIGTQEVMEKPAEVM
ncbi:MAG: hypothetical protein HUK20_01645 [Fibrobacter sp.]|nr:hypothetical protein [Fibrobacter sp.]